MSHLFVSSAERQWVAHLLPSDDVDLRAILAGDGDTHETARERLVGVRSGDAVRWVVIVSADSRLRVNGAPVDTIGMRVLSHQDEIAIAGCGWAYFSEETLPVIAPFPDTQRAVVCGRCRQPIGPGTPSVKCPGCGIWYCQSPELKCWTYSPACAFCPQSTALDGGFSWVPEEE